MSVNTWQAPNTWIGSQAPASSVSISSVMPSMISSVNLFNGASAHGASVSSIMPSATSAALLSVNNPENSASIESIMPSMTSSVFIEQSIPVDLSLTIISAMPSMTSTIKLFSGDILKINNITISFVGDAISVEYKQ